MQTFFTVERGVLPRRSYSRAFQPAARRPHAHIYIFIVGFFILVSSLKVFGHSIHSERRRIYLGKSKALQNDTIIISWVFSFRVIQPTVRGHTSKTFVCFHQFLFIIKTFRDSRLLKYLINKELMTFSNKIQAKTSTWPDMSFYAR